MRYLAMFSFLLAVSPLASAWNAAGHRLSALIAWQAMPVESRRFVATALQQHPDHALWLEKAGSRDDALVFAEATTWPDMIRHDPRFSDEHPGPPLPGFPDMRRHGDWHYVDFDRHGQRERGQLDQQIARISRILRSTAENGEIAWALPWLAHLVADLHQPFHTGNSDDRGGNEITIEDPFNRRRPTVSLHTYWDDLPGPTGLRGKRLRQRAAQLLAGHPEPTQGDIADWLTESRHLLAASYPPKLGNPSLRINAAYREQARLAAERRIVEAGWRLGRLIAEIHHQRVPRGTRQTTRQAR